LKIKRKIICAHEKNKPMEEICNQYNGSGSGLIIRRTIGILVSYTAVELTRKRRGGITGERLVYTSFTAPAKTTTHPTTRSAMVDAEDPRCNSKIQMYTIFGFKFLTASFALVEAY
jgi:hypothetical protein